ncbi:MAG: DUF4105 domain-containing protein [Nitrospinae bacterium]|nr:DUF4105 domain-containing protein [Nitrospinota bacterium]
MSSHKIIFFLLFITASFLPPPALAENGGTYADDLVKSAQRAELSDDRYWHLLMHYHRGIIAGYSSEIYDPDFYKAPDGRENPTAELEATIRGFFRPIEDLREGEEHPQCNFPARLKWLKGRLGIDEARLPKPQCERLEHWRESLGVNRVTLVFASYYMASPASMFGHTLLRLDREKAGESLDLMSYGVNYAANMDTDNPVLMAVKGMFGLFDGVFTTFPYYMKVQEYGNMESRDIWEYQLSLNKSQIDVLVLHLWELGLIKFQYYYFKENCSYELLALIEVGKPGLHLTDGFPVATVPTQTVKALYSENGLVEKRVYRPSVTTLLNARRERMDEAQTQAFKDLVAGKDTHGSESFLGLSDQKKAEVLDSYLDHRQYVVMRTRKSDGDGLLSRSREILLERSRLASENAVPEPPSPRGPEEGHDSNKFILGFGGNNGGAFEDLSFRPAYHDVLSFGTGYAENSQIIYFDAAARLYNTSGKPVFEGMKFVDLVSIIPYDPLYGGRSWQVGFGFRNLRDLGCEECQAFYVNFGDGYAARARVFQSTVIYGMLRFQGELGSRFEKGWRLGAGPDVGALVEESEWWKTQIYARWLRYPDGNVSNEHEFGVKQRFAITKNLEITASVSRIQEDNEAMMAVGAFF